MPSSKALHLSGPALTDLTRIAAYTESQWGSAQKERYLKILRVTFRQLRDSPSIGRSREELAKGLRSQVAGRHLVLYREKADVIEVVRILHDSMDPTRHVSGQ
ncbi:MAG: type II toxin-antitoxin system RelE/ParE family toxin [Rhodospirillaceae bacterium]|nr:type II toxin-antitoxin system RelE/ParE family toxin [Rhodospirillaceae bacterium]